MLGCVEIEDCDKAACSWALVMDMPSACSSKLILTTPYSFTSFKLSLHKQAVPGCDVHRLDYMAGHHNMSL